MLLFGKSWFWKLPDAYRYHDEFGISEVTHKDDIDMERLIFQTNCLLSVAICGNFKAESTNQSNKARKDNDKLKLAKSIYSLLSDEIAPTSFILPIPTK